MNLDFKYNCERIHNLVGSCSNQWINAGEKKIIHWTDFGKINQLLGMNPTLVRVRNFISWCYNEMTSSKIINGMRSIMSLHDDRAFKKINST